MTTPTPTEIADQLTAQADATRTLAASTNAALLDQAADLDALALEVNPPAPAGPLYVENVTAGPTETSVVLHWTTPVDSPRTLVSWGGPAGYIGQQFLLPGTGQGMTYTITGLAPATNYTIDLLAAQVDGTFNSDLAPDGGRVRVTTTTLPSGSGGEPDPDPPAGDYPASPTAWDAKRDWTLAIAGTTGTLDVIDSQADLTAAGLPGSWSNGQWNLSSGGPFEDLDVRGLIYYTGQAPLTLRNCKALGVRYASSSGKTGGLFENCEVENNPALALGQGAINFWGQTGWVIRRSILSGFADGSQCSGNGLVEESVIRDLAYGPTTHNDWIQHYGGGLVRCVRSVFDSVPPQANAHNGIFSSNDSTADYEMVDCDCRVSGAHENLSNIIHANTGTVTLTRCRVRGGRLIADVRYGADSFVSGDPAAT